MLTFVFTRTENIEIALNREIELFKALELLQRSNQEALELDEEKECGYELKNDGAVVYGSSLIFPMEHFDLYDVIEQEILESQEPSSEVDSFLDWLANEFPNKAKQKKKKEKAPKIKLKKPEKREKKDRKKLVIPPSIVKGFLVVLGVVLLLVGGFIVYGKSTVKPTFDEYMNKNEFVQAGKEYPDKVEEIESVLFELTRTKDEKYLKELVAFNKQHATIQGEFDIAMFQRSYKEATIVYEENEKELAQDQTRATLAGYAFLKEKDIKKAEKISTEIDSVELEKYIAKYKQLELTIRETESTINQLQKDPIKNEKAIEKAIDKLYELKENLQNL